MKKIFLFIAFITAWCATMARGGVPSQVRFNNEESDTTKITSILIDVYGMHLNSQGEVIYEIGKRLLGTPYVAGTLDCEPEQLTVDMERLDCTTFVETVLAMAMTIDSKRTSWRDYLYNLEKLRYRNGKLNGYPSRLHYFSDWVVDNNHRGVLQDVTDRVGSAAYKIKTLDFMSTHRDKYAAMKDSINYAGIKNAEIGYRNHKYAYIKPQSIASAQLRQGDVIAIVTNTPGLDVSHMGILAFVDGKPHLMHASSKAGKVIIDPIPLQEYLRRNKSAAGIRVIRLR